MKLLTEITIEGIDRKLSDEILQMMMDYIAQQCCKVHSLDMSIKIKEVIER